MMMSPLDPPPEQYRHAHDADVLALVQASPLAWVVSSSGGFSATPLPLRPALDTEGRLVALLGHFARANPQVARLRVCPHAHVLFMGPHAYVSPSWLDDRTQAPSWHYASAVFECTLRWIEDTAQTEQLLRDLVDAMERERPSAWRLDEMGERYRTLACGVVGFRADIHDQRVVFKLGQDDPVDVFTQSLAGLDKQGHTTLAAWMRHARPSIQG